MPDPNLPNTPANEEEIMNELVKVNQEMYLKNLELVTRNRTLMALREIYDVLNHSLGIIQTSQNLIQKIVDILNFQLGFIALFEEQKVLSTVAITSKLLNPQFDVIGVLQKLRIPQTAKGNIALEVIDAKAMNITDSIKRLFADALEYDFGLIDQIEQAKIIKSIFVYPIMFGGNVLGVMVLGMEKSANELDHADEEILNSINAIIGIGINQARNYTNLDEALRTERDMLDILGHELRTPLTIARNAVLLIDSKIKQNNLDIKSLTFFIEKAIDNLRREAKLVETILTSTKIDSNNLKLNPEPVDMVDAVENSLLAFSSQAAAKGLELTTDMPEKAIAYVDRIRVEEVVDNLISNAIKYTFKGFVRITVKEDNENIVFAVSDSGEGISDKDLKNLGKKFYRANNYTNSSSDKLHVSRPGGTGLGLYVIFNLIKKMDGVMTVTSTLGSGSEFKVTLPKYTNQPVLGTTIPSMGFDKITQRKIELQQDSGQNTVKTVTPGIPELGGVQAPPKINPFIE